MGRRLLHYVHCVTIIWGFLSTIRILFMPSITAALVKSARESTNFWDQLLRTKFVWMSLIKLSAAVILGWICRTLRDKKGERCVLNRPVHHRSINLGDTFIPRLTLSNRGFPFFRLSPLFCRIRFPLFLTFIFQSNLGFPFFISQVKVYRGFFLFRILHRIRFSVLTPHSK
jgi:hypothetical protein